MNLNSKTYPRHLAKLYQHISEIDLTDELVAYLLNLAPSHTTCTFIAILQSCVLTRLFNQRNLLTRIFSRRHATNFKRRCFSSVLYQLRQPSGISTWIHWRRPQRLQISTSAHIPVRTHASSPYTKTRSKCQGEAFRRGGRPPPRRPVAKLHNRIYDSLLKVKQRQPIECTQLSTTPEQFRKRAMIHRISQVHLFSIGYRFQVLVGMPEVTSMRCMTFVTL